MKLLLALSVAACFAGVYSDHEEIKPHKSNVLECAKETKMDMKIFNETIGADFVPTRTQKCFAACFMKKRNLIDANGKYTEKFDADKDVSSVCPPEYGSDDCETAGKLIACLIQHKQVIETVMTELRASVQSA